MEYTTPGEISELLKRDPLKLELLDGKTYGNAQGLQAISSSSIFEPNSNKFHPQGLFSEEIFGPVTGTERYTTEAIIPLHTKIIHPVVFTYMFEKKALYTSVMAGKKHAKLDHETNTLMLSDKDDKEAGTGFGWFAKQLPKLMKAEPSDNLRSRNLHTLLEKYQKKALIDHLVVLPAGLRDLDMSTGRLSKDDINKLYLTLLNLTKGLSTYDLSEDPIFDGIRYQIQLKVAEIFHYVEDVVSDKKGFMQKHYGARRVAYSTRNVISAPVVNSDTADHPTNIKADETMIPLLNLIKSLQPFYVNYVKQKLYGEIFSQGKTENVPVTNPSTLSLEYVGLRNTEANKYTTSKGIGRLLNQYKHHGFRESPVSLTAVNKKEYWLLLTYRTTHRVYIGKTADDLKSLVERHGDQWDRKNVDALRWVEALYLASLYIAPGKHVLVTRYPATGDESIFPTKIHPITTDPDNEVEVIFEDEVRVDAPHYPKLGVSHHESAVVHQSRLSGLDADFDGDMVSLTVEWSKESNEELDALMNDVSNVVSSDMKLKLKVDMDIVERLVFNLSR